jgi:hypothetical protein
MNRRNFLKSAACTVTASVIGLSRNPVAVAQETDVAVEAQPSYGGWVTEPYAFEPEGFILPPEVIAQMRWSA